MTLPNEYTDPKLLPLRWNKISESEYFAHKGYPEVGAVVGKVWEHESYPGAVKTWQFACSAWGGNEKQSAKGYMPTLEDAKAMVEIVTQGPRPSEVVK